MSTIYQPPAEFPNADATDPGLLRDVAAGAARLTPEQGLELFNRLPLLSMGRWADSRCRAIHGDHLRTYVIDRNINYTNICTAKCIFCAFKRTAE
ncbi:MAG: dehypoxanthine futalosine cyclase, partial [Planctomycetota bacterium]